MQKWIGVILLIAGFSLSAVAQDSYADHVTEYVTKYKDMAMAEQQRSGVPASITLGQGVLETQAGQSVLCTDANNHFGIKCRKDWNGETFAHDDDHKDECFRKYGCASDSYKDHSDYLLSSPRYAALFQLKKTDYKGWAHGLKKCGYATNPVYAFQLIKIIEDFGLQDYTVAAIKGGSAAAPKLAKAEVVPTEDAPVPVETANPNTAHNEAKAHPYIVQQVNGLQAFYARKGDVLLEQAIKNNIRYAKLLELNDLPDAPLEADMPIYLVKKRTQGKRPQHVMQDGESMLQVAQAEGMSLKQLRAYNQVAIGYQPVPGTVLYLQANAPVKPMLVAVTKKATVKTQQAATSSADEYIVKDKDMAKAEGAIEAAAPVTEQKPQPEQTVPVEQPVTTAEVKQEPVKTEPVVSEPVKIAEQEAVSSKTEKSGYSIVLDTTTPPAPTPVVAQEKPVTKAPVEVAATTKVEATPPPAPVVEKPKTEIPPVVDPKPVVAKKPEVKYNIPDRTEANAGPQDEFAKLRAKMDRVVYAVQPTTQPKVNTMKLPEARTTTTVAATTPSVKTEEPVVAAQTSGDEAGKYYIVRKGDTGFSIAKKHNISMKQLREWNKLDFEALSPGKKLQVKP